MAKVKHISVNEFEKAVKENFENIVIKEWCGIPVTITKTIPLADVMAIVATVTNNCFTDDGSYLPEATQALIDCSIVEYYTNISLPKSLVARYELVQKSHILDLILQEINTNQYNDIIIATHAKIDYLRDVNVSEFKKAVEQMSTGLNEIRDTVINSLNGLTADDIRKVIEVFSDSSSIEEKAVRAYINKPVQDLHIVGDEE